MKRIYINLPNVTERYITTPQLPGYLLINYAAPHQPVNALYQIRAELPVDIIERLKKRPVQDYTFKRVRGGAGQTALRNA